MLALKSTLPLAAIGALCAGIGAVHADPTAGVDAALFRQAYDANGIFDIEGARLMAVHDLSLRLAFGYGTAPISAAVPGIADGGKDKILDDLVTLDMAFGMTLSHRFAIGLDVAAYRTATGAGYGVRGRYASGAVEKPSTGLISLRPLTNIDPSATGANSLGDELAGPLDVRLGAKLALVERPQLAITAIGSVFLPFGDEDMLLGDANLVFAPELAAEVRTPGNRARLVLNLAARLRKRTVLESYDPNAPGASPDDPRAFLDVGSEAIGGAGAVVALGRRVQLAGEVQGFAPLPDALDWGTCHLASGAPCSQAKYAPGAKRGDPLALVTLGAMLRISADVTAQVEASHAAGGMRGDELRVTTGLVWAPTVAGASAPGRADRDADGIPDSADACPDDPEDRDGFQDEDGCPDPDNDGDGVPDAKDQCPNDPEDKDGFQDADGCPDSDNDRDGIPDALDKCPNDPEDKDGFEDADGCPDPDNDRDGIPDAKDKCPNDPETVNGFQDEDGCPDVRGGNGIQERADRIDLEGQHVAFGANNKLTPQTKQLLAAVAQMIVAHDLTIRVEVHVPLGTRSTSPRAIAAQHARDKATTRARAAAILDYLVAQGVPPPQIQAVGVGSERPLGTSNPTDPINDRVDFIKALQRMR